MAQKNKEKILLALLEDAYGVEETVDAGTDAILTRDLAPDLMLGPTEERNTDRGMLGNDMLYHTSPHAGVKFGVEIAGAGAAGTAPGWGALLQACGMEETITALTDVKYAPLAPGADFPSATLKYHMAKNLHGVVGARGTFTMSLQAGQLPMFGFTFQGLRLAPEEETFPTGIVLSAFKDPMPVNDDNTDFTLFSYAAKLYNLQFDVANTVVARVVVGGKDVIITERKPVATITMEETDISVKDWHGIIAAHSKGALSLTHGVGAGKIVQLGGTSVQLSAPQAGVQDGINTIQVTARFLPTLGADEFLLTVK